ncbi:MAG: cupin domain-containing protein [Caldilineaceae bacterium]|nr:cupin domain-containing protein [Caldilineaceae bacterium]
MPFQVLDFQKDIRNVLTTPEIRARFLQVDVGHTAQSHTHDLGHEIFLILQGQAEFTIEGHAEVLGPGQLCIALTDEMHQVRNVGEEPVIMYLSVTPHIQPTHTMWNEDGTKKPPRFALNTAYDVEPDRETATDELLEQQLAAAEAWLAEVETNTQTQREQIGAYRAAREAGDEEAALAARDAMWASLYPAFRSAFALADVWNSFTSRTVDTEYTGP